jgi:hypothetical protein
MRRRKATFGTLFTGSAIDSTGQILSVITSVENVNAKWRVDNYYVLKNYKINATNDHCTVTLTSETKVFHQPNITII